MVIVKPARRRRATAAAARAAGTAGYTLVVLIMAVTVLNIMLAAALPMWSEMIKRDKEEELISRGFQYVEAIRVFQKRFQRYPTTLDELIKVKPRCIRQLWKDPMTEDGNWTLIFLGQGSPIPGMPDPNAAGGLNQGSPPGAALNPGQNPSPPGQGTGNQPGNGQPGNGLDPNQPVLASGPIVGVRSRSTQKSLLQFFGHEHYNEWEFRIEMLSRPRNFTVPGVMPGAGAGLVLSTRWLGRPMPGFPPVVNGGVAPSGLGPSTLGPSTLGPGGGSSPGGTPPGGGTAPSNPGGSGFSNPGSGSGSANPGGGTGSFNPGGGSFP
jgi:type II secretory pathway pseudopilin PulG